MCLIFVNSPLSNARTRALPTFSFPLPRFSPPLRGVANKQTSKANKTNKATINKQNKQSKAKQTTNKIKQKQTTKQANDNR